MTERKSYIGLGVESWLAHIVMEEAKNHGKTLTEQIADYRDKSIYFEEQVNELRTEMRTMIKASVN